MVGRVAVVSVCVVLAVAACNAKVAPGGGSDAADAAKGCTADADCESSGDGPGGTPRCRSSTCILVDEEPADAESAATDATDAERDAQ